MYVCMYVCMYIYIHIYIYTYIYIYICLNRNANACRVHPEVALSNLQWLGLWSDVLITRSDERKKW